LIDLQKLIEVNQLILWSVRKTTKTAEFNYSEIEKVMMMMMQYTNCVVKAHKVHSVELTLDSYKCL